MYTDDVIICLIHRKNVVAVQCIALQCGAMSQQHIK